MSIPDSLLEEWFTLLTDVPASEGLAAIREHPMKAKDLLARKIGERYHSPEDMDEAARWWHEHFGAQRAAEPVDVRVPPEEITDGSVAAWKLAWFAHDREISRSEARRMVQGGAFEFDGQRITDPNQAVPITSGQQFRAGRFRKGERVKQPLIARIVLEA
jgi:tyrosyl-tRNA synthetase